MNKKNLYYIPLMVVISFLLTACNLSPTTSLPEDATKSDFATTQQFQTAIPPQQTPGFVSTESPNPQSNSTDKTTEISKMLQAYFTFMNEGKFWEAADLLIKPEVGQPVILDKSVFVKNYQSGAKITYTPLLIQDGAELNNSAGEGIMGSYVFPDENPRDCKTYLVKYQMDFDGIIGEDPSGVVFTQKAVLIKQGEVWRLRDFTDPSIVACQKLDGSYGQGNPTVTPYVERTPDLSPLPTNTVQLPTLEPTLLGAAPEEIVKAFFAFTATADYGSAFQLYSASSRVADMGFARFLEDMTRLESVRVLLDVSLAGVCDGDAHQMPKPTAVATLPAEAACLIYNVKQQIFYHIGWGPVPSGSVINYQYWLVKENGQWRIADIGVN